MFPFLGIHFDLKSFSFWEGKVSWLIVFRKHRVQAGSLSLSSEISILDLYTVGHSNIWSSLCGFAPSCWQVNIVWTVQSHRLWSGCLYKTRVRSRIRFLPMPAFWYFRSYSSTSISLSRKYCLIQWFFVYV